MKLRTIVGIAVVSVAGICGAVAIAIKSIDLADVRDLIIAEVEAATERDLEIDGNLRFIFSLRPSLAVENVTLANASWGSRGEMIKLRRLVVQIDVLPLLSGDVRIRRVRLEGADILLETDKTGLGNWEFAAAPNGEAAGETTAEDGSGMALPSVSRIDIEDSIIVFTDGVIGRSRRADVKELRIRADSTEDPISLLFSGILDGQDTEISGTFGSIAAWTMGGELPIDLAGKIDDNELSVNGTLTQPLDHRSFAVNVSAAGANLAELGEIVGVSLPVWRNYSLSFLLGEKDGAMSFNDVRARVGGTNAVGQLTLALDGDHLRLHGALSSTLIDLSDLDESREEGVSVYDDRRVFSDKEIPYRWLKSIDGALTLTADKFAKGDVAFADLKVDVALEKGLLTIVGAEATASGGTVNLSGNLDGRKKLPALALKIRARQVDGGALLHMLNLSDVLRGGKADIDIDVASRGKSLHEIMATLAGTASWSMVGGAIDDGFARILLADLSGLLQSGGGGGQLTCLAARFTAKSGVASTRGLIVDTPAASIFGTGSVNLGRETIKMRFDPSAKETSLAALAVPVDVTGPLADPNVTPDPLGVAATAIGAASTVTGDVFGLLNEAIGGGNGGESGGGCAMALDASAHAMPAKQKSAGEEILDDTGDFIEDIGEGIGDLFD